MLIYTIFPSAKPWLNTNYTEDYLTKPNKSTVTAVPILIGSSDKNEITIISSIDFFHYLF
jgi:hypothetical protein